MVGEQVRVVEEADIKVIIDCSQLMDSAINKGIQNPTVMWYNVYGTPINGSFFHVAEISADSRQCTITEFSHGYQFEINGNYTCEVCSNSNTCVNRSTILHICGKFSYNYIAVSACMRCTPGEPHITQPSTPPAVTPFIISLTCGQDIAVPSLPRLILISCSIFNGLMPLTQKIYKDDILIQEASLMLRLSSADDDDFGT